MKRLLIFPLLAFLTVTCGTDQDNPVGPPASYKGKISVCNQSQVAVRLIDYYQIRGTQRAHAAPGVRLFSGQSVYLQNLLDSEGGQIFPAGDQVKVNVVVAVPDPQYPYQPLFQDSVNVTVNGSQVILIKNGGEYSISPE